MFFSILGSVSAQDLTEFPQLLELKSQFRDQKNGVTEYTTLTVNDDIRAALKNARAKELKLSIPLNENRSFDLDLKQFKVLSDDFILTTSAGEIVDYEQGVFYKGNIIGEEGFATLSINGDHIMGIISTVREGNFSFSKMKNSSDYIIFNENNFTKENDFVCNTPDIEDIGIDGDNLKSRSHNRSLTDCVKIYVEGDNALRIDKGGVAQASAYIMDVMSVVAVLYDNESINMEISEIMIWTSPDGYSTSDSGIALDQFETNNPDINGDLGLLFALGGDWIGGLAWLDVLCGNLTYAYTNISTWYQDFPTYSWTVQVITHELGHNIGSPHTHNCSWPGGAIDNCYETEGGCAPGAPPVNGGTIMSYCHTTDDGINFNNGFGTLPGNLIRNRVTNAGCLTACTGGVNAPVADFTINQSDNCAPSTVQLFDNSTNVPTEWQWVLEGATPNFSTEKNPVVSYVEPGLYDVELTVTNGGGANTTTKYGVVEVISAPIVDFSFVVDESSVSFSNLTTGSSSFYWEFGDGETSNTANPIHSYEEDGVYVVTLLASNNCGDPIITKTVNIATLPIASYMSTDNVGCVDLVVLFTNTSSSNTDSYLWTFEGGSPLTSTQESPTVTYAEAGIYDVVLEVSNDQGTDTYTQENYINALEFPIAEFSSTINGGQVSFAIEEYDATTYAWDFGDGSISTEQQPIYVYNTEGTFEVTLITTNTMCSDTFTSEIEILFTPQVVFSADETSDCDNLTVQFTNATPGSDITYLWTFEGGNPASSTEKNPIVSYSNPGVYDVTLAATNSSGTTILEENDYITVYGTPEINASFNIQELTVDFTNQTTYATSYLWDFGDGSTSTAENPSHTFASESIYTVILTAIYPCGEIQKSYELNLFSIPTASFSSDISEACVPYTVSYSSNSTNTDTWQWLFPGGEPENSTEENPIVVYNIAGQYDVTLTVSNQGGEDTYTEEDYINILAATMSGFSYNPSELEVSFTNESINADNYSWDFGDGNTSTEQNPIHTYDNYGLYDVRLIVDGACGIDTMIIGVALWATATDELYKFIGLDIFPNPVNDKLNIYWQNEEIHEITIALYDVYGRKIYYDKLTKENTELSYDIDMSLFVSGNYILKFSTENAQQIEKIIVH